MSKSLVTVDGLKDLDKALGELSNAVGKGVLRRVGKKALQQVVDAAKENVAVANGDLRDSLEVSTKLTKRQKARNRKLTADGKATVEVFAGADALPHAHLIEFGTGERVVKTTGQQVGSVAPQPFLRPAWDATRENVLRDVGDSLGAEIEKTAARAAKRALKRKG